jgi:competence protein CoiA
MKKEQLRELRVDGEFFCPQCSEAVRLKVGDIVIPHFAHKKEASCSACFSEGESEQHLRGKQQLYEFFKGNRRDVILEPFVKLLRQRPDLLVTTSTGLIPIEFQCSTIQIRLIESRTAGYRSIGMEPLWILQSPAKFYALSQGVGVFHFSHFHECFFTQKSPEGHVFLTYNPQTEQFHYFSSLMHVSGKKYIGLHRVLPISKQSFPFARPKIPSNEELAQNTSQYLSMRTNFLESRILLNRKGINDPFLRNCYELRLLPVNLPLWIGIPTAFSESFREHDCEWQLLLIYFMKSKGIDLGDLSIKDITKFVTQFEDPIEGKIKACIAYRDYIISQGYCFKYLNSRIIISEDRIFKLVAERFLAMQYRN